MKSALYALWVAAILTGSAMIILRQSNAKTPSPANPASRCGATGGQYRAARRMPANHRVRIGELGAVDPGGPSAPAGKFMAREVEAGEMVTAHDLVDLPRLDPVPGKLVLLAPLPGPLATALEAGSTVDLWRDGRLLLKEGRVLAVLCAESPAPACSAAVEASPSAAVDITVGEAAKTQVLLRKQQP